MKDNIFITLFLKIYLMSLNVPNELEYEVLNDKVRFSIGELSTNWMGEDDSFVERIETDKLNNEFLLQHLSCEIEIRNTLNEGIALLKLKNTPRPLKSSMRYCFMIPNMVSAF